MKKLISILFAAVLAVTLGAAPVTPISNPNLTGTIQVQGSAGTNGQILTNVSGTTQFANPPSGTLPSITGQANNTLVVNPAGTTATWVYAPVSLSNTINPRSSRQGLVFNGSAGATVANVPAFGTGAYSYAAWINPNAVSANMAIFDATSGNDPDFYVTSSGQIAIYDRVAGGQKAVTAAGSIVAGKWQLVAYSRTDGQLYINGVASGAAVSDTSNYTNGINRYGQDTSNTSWFNGTVAGFIWNRNLSAAEQLALYEQGAPAMVDMPGPAYGVAAGHTQTSGALVVGVRYIITTYVSSDNFTNVGAGSNATGTIFVATGTTPTTYTHGSTLTALGCLLLPGDSSGGSGLTWYDESGNAANITLPASGVSWARPQSTIVSKDIKTATLETTGAAQVGGNLTVSGTGPSTFAKVVQITGFANPASGTGIELGHDGTEGLVQAFNRTGATATPIWFGGSSVLIKTGGGAATTAATFNSDQTIQFPHYGAGTATFDSSGNITSVSDIRLKNIIAPFTKGLPEVLKLTPQTYTWKPESGLNTDDMNSTLIAQDLIAAGLPEAVNTYRTVPALDSDGKPTTKKVDSNYTVNDRTVIAALVNAVKEQQAEIVALQAQVKALTPASN